MLVGCTGVAIPTLTGNSGVGISGNDGVGCDDCTVDDSIGGGGDTIPIPVPHQLGL